jgi:hypothetical protein
MAREPEWWALPGAVVLAHLLTWHGYGWFRDEFYYVVCARHLAWGYVDQPPLSIAILRLVVAAGGESLFAMRAVVAVAGAATVLLTGLLTRELGGGRWACTLAMTAAAVAPENLALDFVFSMNAFDLVFWALVVYLCLVALGRDRTTWWVLTGLACGLGLLNKISVLWLGFGLAVGLLATPARAALRRPGPWIAAGLAGLLILPHVWWQVVHGWPTLEFMRNASGTKMDRRSVVAFAGAVVSDEGPVVTLLGLLGVFTAFWPGRDPRRRLLAWVWVAVFALLALNGTSRTGYLAPAWNWTFALAALWAESWVPAKGPVWRAVPVAIVVLFGLVSAPLALPVLSTDRLVRYAAALGQKPSTEEKKDVGRLDQFFADMNGWAAIVEDVHQAWQQLPPDERSKAVFFGTNCGEAGAVDVLGPARGLPPAVSSHNNYFFWGPPDERVDAIVIMSQNPTRWTALFEHVVRVGETNCGDCMPYENHRALYIAWGRRASWASVWPALKHFE